MPEPAAHRVARDLHMLAALTRRILESGLGDLSFTQVSILKWLDEAGPRRSQDVAKFLSASAPAATQIIGRMKKKGLLRTRKSIEDRRAEEILLTARARALVARHDELMRRRIENLTSRLPHARLRAAMQGLEAAIGMLLADGEPVADMCLHCGALGSPACVMRQRGYSCPTERESALA